MNISLRSERELGDSSQDPVDPTMSRRIGGCHKVPFPFLLAPIPPVVGACSTYNNTISPQKNGPTCRSSHTHSTHNNSEYPDRIDKLEDTFEKKGEGDFPVCVLTDGRVLEEKKVPHDNDSTDNAHSPANPTATAGEVLVGEGRAAVLSLTPVETGETLGLDLG